MTHLLRGSAAIVFAILTVSSLGEPEFDSHFKDWQSGSHLEVLDGERVALSCPVQHDWWKINGTVYSLKNRNVNLPTGYKLSNRHYSAKSALEFTASQYMDGITLNCGTSNGVSSLNPKLSLSQKASQHDVTIRIVDCVARLFPPEALDPRSLRLQWMCNCSGSRSVNRLILECNSTHEYRRLTFDLPQATTMRILTGLSPQTVFDIKLTLETTDGRSFLSERRLVTTKRKGVPSQPSVFHIHPIKRLRHSFPSRPRRSPYEFGIDLNVASCDVQNVRKYICEVSRWQNFSTILSNFSISNLSRSGMWWNDESFNGSLAENATYYVRVKAVGTDGESLYSAASTVELTADQAEVVDSSSSQSDSSDTGSTVNSDNLLISTIILAVLFVVSGIVALYLIFYLRYRKQHARALEQQELEMKKVNLAKFDGVKKEGAEEKKSTKKRRKVSDAGGVMKANGVEVKVAESRADKD